MPALGSVAVLKSCVRTRMKILDDGPRSDLTTSGVLREIMAVVPPLIEKKWTLQQSVEFAGDTVLVDCTYDSVNNLAVLDE